MQATTVQLWAAAVALQCHGHTAGIIKSLEALRTVQRGLSYAALAPFTAAEATLYRDGALFLYESDRRLLLTVMTDTTERAPTFSLPPFENFDRPNDAKSQPYLHLKGPNGSAAAWHALFSGRDPRALEWEETKAATGMAAILGYDFSDRALHRSSKPQCTIEVAVDHNRLQFIIKDKSVAITVPVFDAGVAQDDVLLNLAAKVLLNAHSTAVMGLLGRYEGNVMTWVRPSNNKLIDRAARYITLLYDRRLGRSGSAPAYARIVRTIFDVRDHLKPGEPIVLTVLEKLWAEDHKTAAA